MSLAEWAALVVGIAGVAVGLAAVVGSHKKPLAVVSVLCVVVAVGLAVSATLTPSPVPPIPLPPAPTTTVARPPTPTSTELPPTSADVPSPAYLTDLDVSAGGAFQGGVGDNIELGVATIAGKSYEHSFREAICINTPIVVTLPSGGYSKLTGVVGFSDDSNSKGDVSVQIELATDPDGPWTRVLAKKLSPNRGTPFALDLPADATHIRLSSGYACSTSIVWGDPRVT